eukprot:CAMPEP_0206294960 /NCGR_PEP_ID=MMETSP0106_2-20121207/4923_1 /ASSEMBLY_ACC=CAM_ASM_000206 /TAXON_ID=81532 /ORGANISM="Acanthoeca-like sp., Strain 10tr" /LENGTH=33 /DNA_ID= /DNA_START= /DNA_END= /DNA_ORIENTATION=
MVDQPVNAHFVLVVPAFRRLMQKFGTSEDVMDE